MSSGFSDKRRAEASAKARDLTGVQVHTFLLGISFKSNFIILRIGNLLTKDKISFIVIRAAERLWSG
jgi:hypothetical protein